MSDKPNRLNYLDMLRRYVRMARMDPQQETFAPHEITYLQSILYEPHRHLAIKQWRPDSRHSFPRRIRTFLLAHRGTFTMNEIRRAVRCDNYFTAHGAVMRLHRAGYVQRRGHNQWEART